MFSGSLTTRRPVTMNRGRAQFVPPPGLSGSPVENQSKPKPNRLRRSCRTTQQTQPEAQSPESHKSDFKTPTRFPRPRPVGGFSGDSPHNDSDFQQDIIWDATSPSPSRLGKRGKKHQAGVVNISDIVSRIAPKYGRPKVVEPTLEQWIGDSATIPCTPDVQVPKPRKKSPRPNGVDDLLKLAKQFDFNMFHQDEEEVEDLHQQGLEVLSGDILDFENGDQNRISASLNGNSDVARTVLQERLDGQIEEDLDFLFDGPTQHVSGNLSQALSCQPPPTPPTREIPGKPALTVLTSGVSTTNSKSTSANVEFEDDWENDDLLNDSLVLEMTQNPQNFSAPKHCSTQKLSREVKYPTPINFNKVLVDQSVGRKVEEQSLRQRTTFKLESNPSNSVKRIQEDTWTNWNSTAADKDTQQSTYSAKKFSQPNTEMSEPQFYQRTSVTRSVLSPSNTKPGAVSSRITSAANDFPDEDLESLFSSEVVWDNLDDDDLLCEMCEDMENQIQTMENLSNKVAHPVGQRTALQPSNRTWDNKNQQPPSGPGASFLQPLPQKQTHCAPGRPAEGWLTGVSASKAAAGSFRYTQTKTAPGSGSRLSSGFGPADAGRAPASKDQFTFKKPSNPVPIVTSKAALAKCSAAEIELKKQQAMERRRQRLKVQNLRAPS